MRLRRVDCGTPGLRRVRAGRGFRYLDRTGAPVRDPATLDRIRALAIPPAWQDVWISPDPRGHIQATGTDAAGRRQYRYHDAWRARRDAEKFDRMLEFAAVLPGLRRQVAVGLARTELDQERILACAVRLLDLGFFRIGSEEYAEANGTFGLATLEQSHVQVRGQDLVFDYPAKGGRQRVQALVDPVVAEIVRTLQRRRSGGPALLAYRSGRRWVNLRSTDINDYLKAHAGPGFTAKDFRTWNATLLAAAAFAASARAPTSPSGRQRAVARAYREVAHYLGNTPAVCRSSYVDPRIVDCYLAGETVQATLERWPAGPETVDGGPLALLETAVVRLLRRAPAIAA
ncbi:MAG TPA: DNA topoisomerase IB [Mycobacteriales bacterium]|nr:DNA topoisomerase IB [Mycobacteriales bacterium]